MVPKGWEVKSFAKLLKSGDVEKIQDGNHGDSHPKSSDFVKSGIPFVMARDLKKGTVDLENCAYITKEQADSLRIGFAKTGDILLSHKGTVGLVAIVPLCDEYMMLTPQVTYYRIPQDSSLMSSYLYQFLLSHEYQSRFKNLAFQSTRSYLGITAQKELSINLPPLPEQQKIAKILSTWDKAISTTERLIENSTQQKKALMQQLLTGKKRLLDESGQPFDKKWERIELGKLLDYKQPTPYLVKSTDYSDEYPTPVLTAGKTFILGYTDEEFGIFSEDLPTIIFDDFTTASKFVDFPFKAKSSAMKMLVAKDGVSIKYIFEVMQALSYAIGGHQRHWISIFANIVIGLPCREEQQKITAVSNNADKEIELLEQQLADLQQEKKALMQVLLTGKKRVVVDGEVI